MLRKAFSATAATGKEPRQRIWDEIRVLGEGFTMHDITRRSCQMPADVRNYLNALAQAKIISVLEPNKLPIRVVWRLVQDEGVDYPRLNAKGERTTAHLAIENVWRTLRILGNDLTVHELHAAICVGEAKINLRRLRDYLNALATAGYLVRTQSPKPKAGDTFRLIPSRYTGPKPPVVHEMQSLQVYDPNLERVAFAKAASQQSEPYEDVWAKEENERARALLAEWSCVDWSQHPELADLLQRTRLELAPIIGTGTVQ